MAGRITISKKTRFEIFKRDSFSCQYCGRSAPEVMLEVDHINPVSKDGDNEITNLITSCFDCNRGKSDRELSDDAVIAKRKAQLDQLQERREQLEMMVEWQTSLIDISGQELSALVDFVNKFIAPFSINENGVARLKKSLSRYGLSEMLTSTRLSADQYLRIKDDKPEQENVEIYFDMIHRIAGSRKKIEKKPYLTDVYRIKNLYVSRGFYYDQRRLLGLLESACIAGINVDTLEKVTLSSRSWTDWREKMEELLNGE